MDEKSVETLCLIIMHACLHTTGPCYAGSVVKLKLFLHCDFDGKNTFHGGRKKFYPRCHVCLSTISVLPQNRNKTGGRGNDVTRWNGIKIGTIVSCMECCQHMREPDRGCIQTQRKMQA